MKEHIGIGEEQPFRWVDRLRVLSRDGHGVCLAKPAGGEVAQVQGRDAGGLLRRERVEDRRRFIGRTIVDRNHAEVGVVLRQQRPETCLD